MKTTKFLFAVVCGSALMLGACKKKETDTNGDTASYGTYVITGKSFYDQDLTTAGLESNSNGSIIAEINSYDLLDNPPTGTSPKMYFSSGFGGGSYRLEVSVGNKAVPINVYPQDFDADQKVSSTTSNHKVWTSPMFNASGIRGGQKVKDVTYN